MTQHSLNRHNPTLGDIKKGVQVIIGLTLNIRNMSIVTMLNLMNFHKKGLVIIYKKFTSELTASGANFLMQWYKNVRESEKLNSLSSLLVWGQVKYFWFARFCRFYNFEVECFLKARIGNLFFNIELLTSIESELLKVRSNQRCIQGWGGGGASLRFDIRHNL